MAASGKKIKQIYLLSRSITHEEKQIKPLTAIKSCSSNF